MGGGGVSGVGVGGEILWRKCHCIAKQYDDADWRDNPGSIPEFPSKHKGLP